MNELKPDDEIAGEEAIHNMHSKFRKYRKIREKEKLDGKDPTYPLVEFINATDKSNILPKSIGLINKNPKIDDKYPMEWVKTIFVGKNYAEPFSEGLQRLNRIKDLNLSSSDLSYGMLVPILEKVPNSLESLNLGNNYNFIPKVYKTIGGLLEDNSRV